MKQVKKAGLALVALSILGAAVPAAAEPKGNGDQTSRDKDFWGNIRTFWGNIRTF